MYEQTSTIQKDSYAVHELSYESPYGGQVPAFLVMPTGEGPFPAIVYVHPGEGNRKTFLPEAEEMARQGVAALLFDAPIIRKDMPQGLSAEQQFTHLVVDIQRGIDVLTSFATIDTQRIAYVGHSLGATWGGVLAGRETRLKAYVLMAGFAKFSEWFATSDHPMALQSRQNLPPEIFQYVVATLQPLDAVHHIKKTTAPVFFQFVHDDEFISQEQAEAFIAAAPEPKDVARYHTDHLFTGCEAAYQDRIRWMSQQLQFGVEA